MDKIDFSTPKRYCTIELVGLPPNPDDLPPRFTFDLVQCGPGLSSAGFDKMTGKWLIDINDGFSGGTDKVKGKIKAVLAKYDLKAPLKEIEERWVANAYLDKICPQSQRGQIESDLKRLPEVTSALWHPGFMHVHLTTNTPFSSQLKEEVTHIITGQGPLF